MAELYVFDREGVTLPEGTAERLPGWRRQIFDRLKNENARQESLCAGLLYAYVLERHGVPRDAAVERLPAGRPVLAGRDDLWFSLSHSGRYVLCAVSGQPVGADVQEIRTVRRSIVRRFHPTERTWLERLPEEEQNAALFRLWTRKEAWVKAVSGERMLSLAEADVIHALPGLRFRDYMLTGGYAAAVCAAEGEELPLPEEVKPAALMAAQQGDSGGLMP